MSDKVWLVVALLAAAFGLVLIARRPTQNLPQSIAGPIAESEAAWQVAGEVLDDLRTYENETNARLAELEAQAAWLERQRETWQVSGWQSLPQVW